MFFDQISEIPNIATRTSCAIFVIPPETRLNLKNALTLSPTDDKQTPVITVEQIRDFIALSNNKESTDRFFIISPADAMNEAAENAFLKTLEEPKPYCHFILLTEHPSALLPTILSRTQIFTLRRPESLNTAPAANPKIIDTAKRLIAAKPQDLPALATDLTKTKTKTREQVLEITATAIEILYKAYFKTGNLKFLAKLDNFITLYENLADNGHIKLHLVADLL